MKTRPPQPSQHSGRHGQRQWPRVEGNTRQHQQQNKELCIATKLHNEAPVCERTTPSQPPLRIQTMAQLPTLPTKHSRCLVTSRMVPRGKPSQSLSTRKRMARKPRPAHTGTPPRASPWPPRPPHPPPPTATRRRKSHTYPGAGVRYLDCSIGSRSTSSATSGRRSLPVASRSLRDASAPIMPVGGLDAAAHAMVDARRAIATPRRQTQRWVGGSEDRAREWRDGGGSVARRGWAAGKQTSKGPASRRWVIPGAMRSETVQTCDTSHLVAPIDQS